MIDHCHLTQWKVLFSTEITEAISVGVNGKSQKKPREGGTFEYYDWFA